MPSSKKLSPLIKSPIIEQRIYYPIPKKGGRIVLSYTLSVVLVSFALYGLWNLLRDVWQWFLQPHFIKPPGCSFLIFVRDQQEEIEELIRYLIYELELTEVECDAVVVDCGSSDLTPAILERLAAHSPVIHTVSLQDSSRSVSKLLPLCRGNIVHILDMTTRLTSREFMISVCALLSHEGREIRIRG